MFLSLWTVPIILRALGQSDYGIYNLVAGIIAMLAFLNDSMTVVVQRYMSVTMGGGDRSILNQVYNASIRIHIFLGIIIVLLLEISAIFLFTDFLNIPSDRIYAARCIFQFMIVSTFLTIVAVPFDAALNAYENMVTFSIVSIFESIGKLLLAFFILYNYTDDRLVIYGLGIACISCLGVIARYIVVKTKYSELSVCWALKIPNKLYKDMFQYAGWNTFGSIAMLGKNQGIAVIFNVFMGTIINAAYGIANQINGLLSSFTSNIQKAISPQLMKSEGANNHEGMFTLSFSLVKISTTIYSLMAIPLVVEMDQILKLWLGNNVPDHTVAFCQLTIVCQLLFQLSSGVALTIDAVGKIKVYRLVLSAVLILNLPVAYMVLKCGFRPEMVIVSILIIEILCLYVRLYFAKKIAFFPVRDYIKQCLFPMTIIILGALGICFIFTLIIERSFWRIILTSVISSLMLVLLTYYFVLSNKERDVLLSLKNSLKNKFIKND